jgi:hypothetical protein
VTYLLDANVLSETRKRQPAAGVADWIAATPPERMYVSVLTLGEIEQGSPESAAEVICTRPPPSSTGSGMWRAGSRTGCSRSPSRSLLPGAVSSTHSLSRFSTRSSRQRRGYTA